ncbi:MAG: hypothetical protein KTR26_11980 [Flammeovirgaceae bacterium]|nr:hypothetical protein [Flammeovirgaceae bacterium]
MRIALFVIFLFPAILIAQENLEDYNLKDPGEKSGKKCKKCQKVYNSIPKEFRVGISLENRTIFINFTHQDYYDLIFDKKWDGVAVEVVTSDQFGCNVGNYEKLRGFLMAPMFKKEMLKNKIETINEYVSICYGTFPDNFDPLETEFNLLTIQKKYWCNYNHFVNLDDNLWELLEMGLYKDTVPKSTIIKKYEEVVKKIRFSVPFEKSKTEFKKEDIKPLYDSLNLTDFNIKKIRIRAYSSIEGNERKNKALQIGRANSIIEALQTYQTPEMLSEVVVGENWSAFRKDIKGTEYEYLLQLPKEEVKIEIENKKISEDLEPIFEKHRKAEIELSLQKRFEYDENPEGMKIFFNQKIKDGKIEEALYLQQIIFEKIKSNELPESFIGTLEVPKISESASLYNNFAIFGFTSNESEKMLELQEQISAFNKLAELFPGNAKINYNLTVLKLKSWRYGESETNELDLKESIKALGNLGIDKSLINRLKLNYNIILSYYLFKRQEFKKKDRVMKEVFRNYRNLELDDNQILIIAKYFASYSNFELANAVLEKRVFEIGVNNDLVFYFIELNLKDLKKKNVQAAWMKALEMDRERVCKMLLPIPKGGISFQLLADSFLNQIFCKNCNN